jgi:hypothetical protein
MYVSCRLMPRCNPLMGLRLLLPSPDARMSRMPARYLDDAEALAYVRSRAGAALRESRDRHQRVHRRGDHPPTPAVALSPTKAAASLSMSADYFREHVSPQLRWVRHGRKRVVAVAELERWLEANASLALDIDR